MGPGVHEQVEPAELVDGAADGRGHGSPSPEPGRVGSQMHQLIEAA
jgi:hypothetical protein